MAQISTPTARPDASRGAASTPQPAASERPTAVVRISKIAKRVLALVPIGVYLLAGYQRRWMHDDGFINLRIVRNILSGHGPVFNIGERVEAGTSPLWLLLLAGLGATGARLEDAAVYGGLVLAISGLAIAMFGSYWLWHDGRTRRGHASWLVPLGAMAFVVLPPAWDFATSGLETGLAIFWLGGSFLVVVAVLRRRGKIRPRLVGALLGLGWLIRPELALYAAAMFVPLARECMARRAAGSLATRARELVLLGLATIAIPGAYQIFRMGYYGALTANSAIAKEAFRSNWPQGWCYFRNFFGLYLIAVPAAVLALFAFLGWRRRRARRLHSSTASVRSDWTAPLLLAAAAGHVIYVVAMGGDYMHGRMFLPAVFAATMPCAVIAMNPVAARGPERALRVLGGVVLTAWSIVCATQLRVSSENQCDIGDERGWYAAQAKKENPIHIEEFEHHPFHAAGVQALRSIQTHCPSVTTDRGPHLDCRRAIELESVHSTPAVADSLQHFVTRGATPDVAGVVAAGAVGMVGFVLPSTVHLVDRHGLGDPVGARLAIGNNRGRPGHEKRLSDPWIVARFTDPVFPEEAAVTSARAALGCGRLAALLRRVDAPLTWSMFLQNVTRASWMQQLRVPSDVFAAEERFCNVTPAVELTAGGAGGSPFSSRCPVGTEMIGIRGSIRDLDRAIAQWMPVCRLPAGAEHEPGDDLITGPAAGEATEHRFDLQCPEGSAPIGVFGRSSWVVHQIGLICRAPRPLGGNDERPSTPVGMEEGTAFRVVCPEEAELIGLTARCGTLIDAAGAVCARPPLAQPPR